MTIGDAFGLTGKEIPKTFTFQVTNETPYNELWEQARILGENAQKFSSDFLTAGKKPSMNQSLRVIYKFYAYSALRPSLLASMGIPSKPLNRRQKVRRFVRNAKNKQAQKAHDKAVKNGAYCDSDY